MNLGRLLSSSTAVGSSVASRFWARIPRQTSVLGGSFLVFSGFCGQKCKSWIMLILEV